MQHKLFTLAMASLFSLPAYAETADFLLEDVIVTATRFDSDRQTQPIASQVITAQEIRDSAAMTVSEALSKLGGVHTRINFTGVPDSPIDLRGFGMAGDQNTLVLINGLRLSDNENTSTRLSSIPIDSIERIEIVRGAGAVLYGGGATGGTINIITRSPLSSGLNGKVSTQIGSHDLRDFRGAVQYGTGNWGLNLNVQRYENDNYRDNNRTEQNAASGELRFGRHEDFIALAFNIDDQNARLPGARTEAELATDPRGATTPSDYIDSQSALLAIRSEKIVGNITLALDVSQRDKTARSVMWGGAPSETNVDITTVSPRIRWKSKLAGAPNSLTFGFDWSDWSYGTDIWGRDESGEQKTRALYVRDEVVLPAGTRLSLGARRETVEQTITEQSTPLPKVSTNHALTAYELALQQDIGARLTAYGRLGRSFRVANIDDNRCWFAPCALLKPQRSQDRELGLRWRGKGASFRASVFDMEVDDEIHYNALTFSNMNLSPTRHRGVELEGKLFVGVAFDVAAHYTYTQARFREGVYGGIDVSGNDVPLVPTHRLGLNLGWQIAKPTRLTVNTQYVGHQRYDNDQANLFHEMPSHAVTDIKLNHDVGAWRLAAGINNLFDAKYYSYGIVNGTYTTFNAYPEDRRNAYVSAEYRF